MVDAAGPARDPRRKDQPFNSRAIVDATIPYERMEEFPPVAETSPEYREEVREKWSDQLPLEGV